MFSHVEMVQIAYDMKDIFGNEGFLGDFAEGVMLNPELYEDERSQDILLTFKETRSAIINILSNRIVDFLT
jgi:hypothetical protein